MFKTTGNLRAGDSIVIDGEVRVIIKKEKAFKAPEYFISYAVGDYVYRPVFHSRKKWEVLEMAGA